MQESDCPGICDDGSMDSTNLGMWYRKIVEGMKVLGKDLEIAKGYKRCMEEVGFVDVQEKIFYWPVGVGPSSVSLPYLIKFSYIHTNR